MNIVIYFDFTLSNGLKYKVSKQLLKYAHVQLAE